MYNVAVCFRLLDDDDMAHSACLCIRSFVCLFDRLFVRLFVHSFIRLFVRAPEVGDVADVGDVGNVGGRRCER
jgi:hypothetical protein